MTVNEHDGHTVDVGPVTAGFTHEQVAQVCHEANRALQQITDDPAVSPPWDEAPEWQRVSAIEGVAAAIGGATPEEQHEAWCQQKVRDGWTYGEVKDEESRTHPCLVPYEDLPAGQQAKDHVFVAIVQVLAG